MQIYSFTKESRKSEEQSKIKSREKVIKKKASGLQRISGASAVVLLTVMAAVPSSWPLVVVATSPRKSGLRLLLPPCSLGGGIGGPCLSASSTSACPLAGGVGAEGAPASEKVPR